MRNFVLAVLSVVLLASCASKDVVVPEPSVPSDAGVFHRDANIAIANLRGETSGNTIKFRFSTFYEKDLAKIEVISGPYENMLCFFHVQVLSGNSLVQKNYTITEEVTSPNRFYVIKYTLRSGAWVMTPAFRYSQ